MAGAEDAAPSGENEPSKEDPNDNSNFISDGRPPELSKPDPAPASMAVEPPELDDFGLPIRAVSETQFITYTEPEEDKPRGYRRWSFRRRSTSASIKGQKADNASSRASSTSRRQSLKGGDSEADEFEDAVSKPASEIASVHADTIPEEPRTPRTPIPPKEKLEDAADDDNDIKKAEPSLEKKAVDVAGETSQKEAGTAPVKADTVDTTPKKDLAKEHARNISVTSTGDVNGISEYSHQQLTTEKKKEEKDGEDEWQTMPAYAPYDIYDDDNKLVAQEHVDSEDEKETYAGLGGAGKGYTRVFVDDDAESATSLDDKTQYLFNKTVGNTSIVEEEGEQQRDAVSQLQATKDLLTEGQRIAYVGVTRLELSAMTKEAEGIKYTRKTKKEVQLASESLKMWSQKMMIRLYTHMDISSAEQIMIEQLSEHGVEPKDLTPVLLANARVKNPMAESLSPSSTSLSGEKSPRPLSISGEKSPRRLGSSPKPETEAVAEPPPPYETQDSEELDVQTPSQLPTTAKIDIDLRWTVLCDLFLVLIADSIYDSRSRVLLEKVANSLDVPWIDICRFEKKITDALEMQQNAEKENWNEDDHMENRRKMALKRRYVMMGLATVGGGLVIGLSAGLLAPVIGAGLAAGFTTIGVTGTSSFLAGAGGAAIITSGAAASGSVIGVRAANRRTGAVRTFEYRPLHNNKRVNLIVTVSGWMTGKVDDVRLPYSTVDPVMGDIYSVLWEPEMLTSMGDTINILATEALTQGLQQLLGSTILVSLMAALQLPVVLTKLSYLIDNPWAVSLDRATSAGLILADSLMERNLGTRPITLVGYSLGSRVIFSCLQELAKKAAFGIVQNVYIFGSPVVVKSEEFLKARTVVSGRFVNGFNRNDWILGYLFRLTNGGIRRIAGLAAVDDVPGLENMDLTDNVVGHMDYRTAMPRLMRKCGWLVESDEFTEIEDPDPENHTERQRELINEIEEARKELEKEGKPKGAFSFFSKKKQAQKEEWELYEDSAGNKINNGRTEDKFGNNHGILFDVDAIRAELAKESLEVKELKSTLPPMKLDLTPQPSPGLSPRMPGTPTPDTPGRKSLREPKGADTTATLRTSHEYRLSGDRASFHESRPSSAPTPPNKLSAEFHPRPAIQHVETDDGLSMTFDTSEMADETPEREPEQRPPPPPKEIVSTPGPASEPPPAVRPDIKTAQTVPNIMLTNAWAEEDDEEFGKEKEISMTFA